MKTRNFIEKIRKYVRELSVVVVGIAITFAISNWINSKNEKKAFELYLNAVKLELEENLNNLKEKKVYYERAVMYSDYLLKNEMKNLHPDTLKQYIDLNRYLPFFSYKASAFDMFKSSGMMRLMKDKNKLQAIWNCYSELEGAKVVNDFYIQRKIAELDKLNVFANSNMQMDEELLFGFFTNGMAENWLYVFNYCAKDIEHTLADAF